MAEPAPRLNRHFNYAPGVYINWEEGYCSVRSTAFGDVLQKKWRPYLGRKVFLWKNILNFAEKGATATAKPEGDCDLASDKLQTATSNFPQVGKIFPLEMIFYIGGLWTDWKCCFDTEEFSFLPDLPANPGSPEKNWNLMTALADSGFSSAVANGNS